MWSLHLALSEWDCLRWFFTIYLLGLHHHFTKDHHVVRYSICFSKIVLKELATIFHWSIHKNWTKELLQMLQLQPFTLCSGWKSFAVASPAQQSGCFTPWRVSLYYLRTQAANESRIREGAGREEQNRVFAWATAGGFVWLVAYDGICLRWWFTLYYGLNHHFSPPFGRLCLVPGIFTWNPSMAYQFCGCKSQRCYMPAEKLNKGFIGTTLVEEEPLSQLSWERLTRGSS